MALLKMKKIKLAFHKESAQPAMEALQKLGALEFSEITDKEKLKKNEKTEFELNYISSRLDHSVSFLSKYEKKSFFRDIFEGMRTEVGEKEMQDVINNFYYNEIIERVYNVIENINKAEAKLEELKSEKELLELWFNLDIKLSAPRETKNTRTLFLSGETCDIDNFLNKISKDIVSMRPNENSLAIIFLKSNERKIRETISSYKLGEVELPKRRGAPEEECERIGRAMKKAGSRLNAYHRLAESLTKHLPKLRVVSDYIHWRKKRFDLVHESYGTEESMVFEGWCPEKALPVLKKELSRKTKLFAMEEIETKEEPPVEIMNPPALKPFEAVTRLYGLPTAKDLDPTPYLAGFFFIFFGICLSDVGYGVLITSFTLSLLLLFNLNPGMSSFIKLLMAGGISSIIAGVIFGGYFGIDPSLLPEFAQRLQYFDPINSPLPIFYLALILGIIQVIMGMILSILRDAQNNNLKEGLAKNIPWLLLFASLALWAGSSSDVIPAIIIPDYIWLIYTSLALIILSGAFLYKGNIFAKAFMGFLNLYNSVGYLSDVLSYSRLLALGLATSALAFSVNLIAGMAYEAVPYVGFLLMIIILVVGHIFNLVVNILAAFIHTARLQFVEFFGKFISGSGRQFKPFYREERNIFLKRP